MTNSTLEKLKKQRDQLNARIKDAEARQRQKERKRDTRRKIIIGAIAQTHAEQHPQSDFAQELNRLLHKYVTKPVDRETLGLPALPLNPEFTKHADNADTVPPERMTYET